MINQSVQIERDCYEKFKNHFQDNDTYKDILETHREIKLLDKMEKGVKVFAREKAFKMVFENTANRVSSSSPSYMHFELIQCN